MNKQFKVGDRVKFFEPVEKHITHGTLEEFIDGETTCWMNIRNDEFDGEVSISAKKIDGRWLAFSVYGHEYTLEVFPENKFCPSTWIKDCLGKIIWKFRKLKWATQRLQKQT
jgi:hypothetical protein